jgi:hypothetical protein
MEREGALSRPAVWRAGMALCYALPNALRKAGLVLMERTGMTRFPVVHWPMP